jgi:GlpG protein
MSGVAFGWFGYVWIRSVLNDRDIRIHNDVVVQMLVFQALCSLGLLGPVANTAHIMGAVAGMALAALESLRRFLSV